MNGGVNKKFLIKRDGFGYKAEEILFETIFVKGILFRNWGFCGSEVRLLVTMK